MLKQAHEYVVSSATSVSLTELQKIAQDSMYMEDTLKTSQSYVALLKHKDAMEDQALQMASDNIK